REVPPPPPRGRNSARPKQKIFHPGLPQPQHDLTERDRGLSISLEHASLFFDRDCIFFYRDYVEGESRVHRRQALKRQHGPRRRTRPVVELPANLAHLLRYPRRQ